MIYTNYREIDKAGRIVISKDIRSHLNINPGDMLLINADDDCITIKKAESKCVFCNSQVDLTEFNGKFICAECLGKLSETR
ncbi:MAG: AbrB/MazE/SpoVT family DNA-binding domain-containing protein [Ruminococcus sp.]|nr:AbrB/MazE/SpoVT family DNA-binding domain-containing protein [Ruminococcus sp.]